MRNAMWVGGGITGMGEIPMLGVKEKGIAKVIRDIFRNGEQGFFYDPSDLKTQYQDAAGAIPVTASEQPVGLILDKSKGLVLGLELSNYSAGFNSLAGISPVGATLSLEGTALVITAQTGTSRRAEIPISGLTVGKFYKIKFIARKNEIGIQQNFQQFTAFNKFHYQSVVTSTTASEYTFILEATSVSGVLRAYASSAEVVGAQMVLEAVSVREVKGNHAYQSVSASRPILRKNAVTGANYLEFDGTDDFLQTPNIDFTGTDKVSLFAGVRKLSDAAAAVVFELSPAWIYNEGSFILHAPYTNGGSNFYSGARGTATASISLASRLDGSKYAAPVSAVISDKHDISGDYSMMLVNGASGNAATADKGTGNFGNYPLYIGRRAGTASPFNGHIYGLIGIGKLLSGIETTAIEKELAKRTGVALNV